MESTNSVLDVQTNDALRALQQFPGLMGSKGFDGTDSHLDAVAANVTGTFVQANPDGTSSVQGKAVSNVQTVQGDPTQANHKKTLMLLGAAAVGYFFLN